MKATIGERLKSMLEGARRLYPFSGTARRERRAPPRTPAMEKADWENEGGSVAPPAKGSEGRRG